MGRRVVCFLPGDYRPIPERARASRTSTRSSRALSGALQRSVTSRSLLDHFLTTPADAIDTLSGIDDPMIGVYAHWVYGPHTTDGVVGSDTPLLLASNFDGTWPGLVGLLNTGACLTSLGRAHSRLWSDAADLTTDKWFMDALDTWVRTGRSSTTPAASKAPPAPIESRVVDGVFAGMRAKRPLAAMLGDTSMGMINGYFGPQRLARVGFSRAQDRPGVGDRTGQDGRRAPRRRRARVRARPRCRVPLRRRLRPSSATRNQLRDYCAVLDLLGEFRADCLGWQYQLGLIRSLPPSDFAEGLLNSACRPETNGSTIATCDRSRPGQPHPDGAAEAAAAGARACTSRSRSTTCASAASTTAASSGCCSTRARPAPTRSTTIPTRCGACTRTGNRPRTSRSRAARSPARACRARSRGRARGSTARSS